MAISSRETKKQTTSPAGYASTSRFPTYLKISYAYPMTPSEKVLLFLCGKKLLHFLAVLFQRLLFIKHAGTTCNNSANELFLLHAVSEMFIPLICLSHLLPKHHLWTREPCSSDREEPLPTTVCYNQKTWFHDSQ